MRDGEGASQPLLKFSGTSQMQNLRRPLFYSSIVMVMYFLFP